jgi:uncharacterized protein YndB with AHSA1/START domain
MYDRPVNREPARQLIVTTPSDLEVVMTRVFPAPRELVFEAMTKPEHIRRWLRRAGDVMTICEVDLRPGGAWRYVWQLREGGEMAMYGVYQEVDAPRRVVNTEFFEGADFETMGAGTLNTLVLEENEGGTKMISTVLYKSREARDSAIRTGMEEGAAETFSHLDALLENLAGRS